MEEKRSSRTSLWSSPSFLLSRLNLGLRWAEEKRSSVISEESGGDLVDGFLEGREEDEKRGSEDVDFFFDLTIITP